ncbi:probable BOI-related E3 ubiquitin-protein ligase 2 [Phalaenopsis equestris]|uniref:probable BOI-related E3 ubiquitin-protein ligase 2 n=1 Tax=Phalaenopsis equestris TaxID=78828 RepID=UPI0009E45D69|nr:probable BOI-related E3 ubiquitin-protein ligase 2 [Phalaenopsis equestris]
MVRRPLFKCKRVLSNPAMAVQAEPMSNAAPADFQSRVEMAGGVLEGVRRLQRHDDQIRSFFNAAGDETKAVAGAFINPAVLSDLPQSDLTCNVSRFSRKRRMDETMIAAAAPIYERICFRNAAAAESVRADALASAAGFQVASGFSFAGIESAAASTSGVSSSYLYSGSDVNPELLALLYQQGNEIDDLLRCQSEMIRLGMEELRKKYCREVLFSLGQRAINRLREKEIELENLKQKNADLEERARKISGESLIWFNLAKNNEAVVSSLKTSLEQAMIQNSTASPTKEGYGDSDCSPFPADDARSCCFETALSSPPAHEELRRRMVCQVCREKNVCVLVLPCKHLCLCKSCDAGADTCPTCRSHKNATLQIFMS